MSQWNAPPPGDGEPPTPWGRPAPTTPPQGPPQGPPPPGAYGSPQFGSPQFGGPQFGVGQPAAVPYQYGKGASVTASLASPGKRIAGYLIDGVILAIAVIACWIPVVASASSAPTRVDAFGSRTTDLSGASLAAVVFAYAATLLVPIIYHVTFVAVRGQTPGAMLVKVKVVRLVDGETPGWGAAILRWLPNLAGFLCSLISLGLMIWALVNLFSNDLRQTPFDLAAKTVVIDVG